MKNKKILILGSKESFTLEKMYQRAFSKLEHNVNFFHDYKIRKFFLSKFFWKFFRFIYFILIRKKIIKYLEDNNLQYDLIVFFKGIYINRNFLKIIRKISTKSKIINIFPDNPFDVNYFRDISNKNILQSISEFDYVFIYSKEILKKLKKKYPNNKFLYLPFGYSSDIHKSIKIRSSNRIKYDLSFIGTADDERYNTLKELSDCKIILAGDGWNNYKLEKNITYVKNVNYKNFSKLLNSSKVCLNILRKQNRNSHNMKTFEIPSMGGLMITNRTMEQNFFFPENKASLMYGNLKELKFKINKINNNFKKFNKIKNKSFVIVKKHSYVNRAKYILKTIYA